MLQRFPRLTGKKRPVNHLSEETRIQIRESQKLGALGQLAFVLQALVIGAISGFVIGIFRMAFTVLNGLGTNWVVEEFQKGGGRIPLHRGRAYLLLPALGVPAENRTYDQRKRHPSGRACPDREISADELASCTHHQVCRHTHCSGGGTLCGGVKAPVSRWEPRSGSASVHFSTENMLRRCTAI